MVSPLHVRTGFETELSFSGETLLDIRSRQMFHKCSKGFSTPWQVYWYFQWALESCLASNPRLTGPKELFIIQRATDLGILGPSTCISFSDSQISIRGDPTLVFL